MTKRKTKAKKTRARRAKQPKSIWRKGAHRFRLPGGNRTLYVSEEKYPRLWQWIQMNEATQ